MQFNPEKLQAGGGSGFGLFISKSIVGLHDGKIRAFSAGEGQGSSFMFRIPMRRKKVLIGDGAVAIQHKQQHHNQHGLEQGPRLGLGPGPGLQVEQIDLHDRPQFSAVELVAPQRWLNEPLASSSLSSTSLPMVVSTRRSAIQPKGGDGGVTDGGTRLAPGPGLGLEPVPVSGSGLPKGQGLTSLVPGLPGGYGTMLPLPLSISQKAGYYRRVSFPPPEDLDLQHSPRSHPPLPPDNDNRLSTTMSIDNGAKDVVDDDDERISHPSATTTSTTTTTTTTTTTAGTSSRRGDRSVVPTLPVGNNGVKYHLLVVDDSAMSRKMMMKTLKGAGHTCEEAEDGAQAVQKVKERFSALDVSSSSGRISGSTTTTTSNSSSSSSSPSPSPNPFQGILMDFVMPVMDGPDATKAIRSLGYTLPIIGCTGNTLDGDLQRFKDNGCDKVLGKPFDLALFHSYMTGGTTR